MKGCKAAAGSDADTCVLALSTSLSAHKPACLLVKRLARAGRLFDASFSVVCDTFSFFPFLSAIGHLKKLAKAT